MTVRSVAILASAVVSLMSGTAANAQEKVTLRVGDWLPTSHFIVVHAATPFMEKAKELSGGSIDFQYYPAEQLGKAKDALTMLTTGVVDIVDISPAYISDKFVLAGVAELPDMFGTACEGTAAFAALAEDGGLIDQNEFAKNGVRVLVSVALGPYRVLTVKNPIEGTGDLSGLKLRSSGASMDLIATALGSVPVRMPGGEILTSLTRGTIDGTISSIQSVKVFDWQTTLKHMNLDMSLGSFVTVYAISNAAWDKLSPEQQNTLKQAGDFATKNHCEYVDGEEPKAVEELKGFGIAPDVMKEGELDKVKAMLAGVKTQWSTAVDARGLSGTQVLEAFAKAVSESK